MSPVRRVLGTCLVLAGILAALFPVYTSAAAPKGDEMLARVTLGGKTVKASVVTGDTPVRLSVRLNGKDVSELFRFRPAAAGPVTLGRNDGLRFGKNRLSVRALFASGRTRKAKRNFRLSSRAPLPDAGANRTIYGGDRIRLSARGTRARGKGRLRFRWKVVAKPRGSKARLTAPRSKRPRLKTDRGGTYRVRLAVRKGRGPVAFDQVQVEATDSKMTRAGTFVSTAPFGPGAADGPASSLQIFSGSSAGTYPVGSAQPGPVVTFMFDRATMSLISGPTYTGVAQADATKLQNLYSAAVQSTGQTPLVISAGNGYGAMSNQFQGWLNNTLNAKGLSGGPSSFALAGVSTGKKLPTGTPPPTSLHFVNGDTTAKGRLSGQILPDASENWAFVPSDLPVFGTAKVDFDTDENGAISLAGETYPQGAPPSGCPDAGGFQVLAVSAAGSNPLRPLPISVTVDGRQFGNGDTFWSNACALNSNSADQESRVQEQAMLALLNAVPSGSSQPPALVFIQSVGNVAPSVTTPDGNFNIWVDRIGGEITNLGGSIGTFLGLFGSGTTGYSFIGQTFTNYGGGDNVSGAEVATNMPTTPAARLIGNFRRDPAGRYIPGLNSAAEGQRAATFKQSLPQSELVRQVDTSTWKRTPFPNQTDPAWVAALQDLAEAAGLTYDPDVDIACYRPSQGKGDVRSSYCGGVPEGESPDTYWVQTVLPAINSAPYSQNGDYSASVFQAVKDQLAVEFPLVDDANEAANALSQAFTASQSNDAKTITQSYVTTVSQAQKNAILEASTTNLGWIGEVFDLAAAVTGFVSDGVSGVLWVTSASLANEGNLAAYGNGSSVVTGLTGNLAGTPAQAAGAVAAQISDQVEISNEVRFAVADAIVSDWGRLQGADDDLANVPDTEAIADAKPATRFSGISYVWQDLLKSSTTLSNLGNSSINNYNATGNGLQPAYDLGFVKSYGCWLSGTGIFHDGESIESVYQGATAASVYSDPHNLFSWQRWNSYLPYVLTAEGKNPSGGRSNPPPEPAAQYYGAFLPDALINGFSAAQPSPGSPLSPVVNGAPPGLGLDRDQFFDRMFLDGGDTVTCHGPSSN